MGSVNEGSALRLHTWASPFCFFFIEKCSLYSYADDNSLDSSSENLADVLYSLRPPLYSYSDFV